MSNNNTPPKIPLDALIGLMELPHRTVATKICRDYAEIMRTIPGSATKHQTWPGGYISHIEESMNLALPLYHQLTIRRKLDFSVSSVLFCIFMHDFDKLQRYRLVDGKLESKGLYSKNFVYQTRDILRDTYDYHLTDEEFNALQYAHGEGKDFQPGGKRVMLPLATLVHCCDVMSARLWHDYGKFHDSWEA